MPIRLALVLLLMMIGGGTPATAQDATPVEESSPSPIPEPTTVSEEPATTIPDATTEATEPPVATEPVIDATETPSLPSTPATAGIDDEPLSVQALVATTVSPVDPVIVQPTCIDGVVIAPTVTPVATTGLTYQVVDTPSPGRSVIVTAALTSTDFAFGPVPSNWTVVQDVVAIANFDIDPVPPCEAVVPLPPVVTQARCEGGSITQPQVTVPDNTSVISYSRAGQVAVGRSVIVTADLEREGDTWVDPLPSGWSRQGVFPVYTVGPLAKAPCVPASPIITAASCLDGIAVPASVAAPPNSTVIRYQLQSNPGSAVVFASLEGNAVAWADPLPDEWRQVNDTLAMFFAEGLNVAPCIETNLVSSSLFPDMIEGLYVFGDSIDLAPILPASPGIAYAISGTASLNMTITVTAELQDGYDWPETLPVGWTAIDEDTAVYRFVIDGTFDYAENPPVADAPVPPLAKPTTSPVVTSLPSTGAMDEGGGAGSSWLLPALLLLTLMAAGGGRFMRRT
jgi:hypothetical protein